MLVDFDPKLGLGRVFHNGQNKQAHPTIIFSLQPMCSRQGTKMLLPLYFGPYDKWQDEVGVGPSSKFHPSGKIKKKKNVKR